MRSLAFNGVLTGTLVAPLVACKANPKRTDGKTSELKALLQSSDRIVVEQDLPSELIDLSDHPVSFDNPFRNTPYLVITPFTLEASGDELERLQGVKIRIDRQQFPQGEGPKVPTMLFMNQVETIKLRAAIDYLRQQSAKCDTSNPKAQSVLITFRSQDGFQLSMGLETDNPCELDLLTPTFAGKLGDSQAQELSHHLAVVIEHLQDWKN